MLLHVDILDHCMCGKRTVHIFAYSLCGAELLPATDLGMLGLLNESFNLCTCCGSDKKKIEHDLQNIVEHQDAEQ